MHGRSLSVPSSTSSGELRSRRRRADSNRCTRLCRPLPNHSATAPRAAHRSRRSRANCREAERFRRASAGIQSRRDGERAAATRARRRGGGDPRRRGVAGRRAVPRGAASAGSSRARRRDRHPAGRRPRAAQPVVAARHRPRAPAGVARRPPHRPAPPGGDLARGKGRRRARRGADDDWHARHDQHSHDDVGDSGTEHGLPTSPVSPWWRHELSWSSRALSCASEGSRPTSLRAECSSRSPSPVLA